MRLRTPRLKQATWHGTVMYGRLAARTTTAYSTEPRSSPAILAYQVWNSYPLNAGAGGLFQSSSSSPKTYKDSELIGNSSLIWQFSSGLTSTKASGGLG